MPAATGRRMRNVLFMSACRDSNRFEQLLFEPVGDCTSHEVGTQSTRLKRAFDQALALAAVVENEDVAAADDLAFHAADLANALNAPYTIAHALDMHEDIDGTRDLGAQSAQRQVSSRHQHHVFEPEQRIAWAVGVDRGHRPIMAGVHGLEHVKGFVASNLADDDAIWAHPKGVAQEFALGNCTDTLDVRRARFQLHDMRL